MGTLIIAIVGGDGLELKECSATACYKAALIMPLHRVRSAAARRKWSQMVNGRDGRMADTPDTSPTTERCAATRYARYPAWSHCSKGTAGMDTNLPGLQGLCGG